MTIQNTTIIKKNGDDVTRRVLEENDHRLVLLTDTLKNTKVEVRKADILTRQPSKLSPMPEGLVRVLSKDEILDLRPTSSRAAEWPAQDAQMPNGAMVITS